MRWDLLDDAWQRFPVPLGPGALDLHAVRVQAFAGLPAQMFERNADSGRWDPDASAEVEQPWPS